MSLRHPDPVTNEVRLAVLWRDGGCVAPLLDPNVGACRDRWGHSVERTDWTAMTVDHVKDQPGMGLRAPSDQSHLVTICWGHHVNGSWATSHRPELREYLRRQRRPDPAP